VREATQASVTEVRAGGRLPDRTWQVERLEQLARLMRPAPADDPIQWVARPWVLAIAGSRLAEDMPVPGEGGRVRLARRRLRFAAAAARWPPLGPGALAGDVLFVAVTENQARVQHPVARRVGAIAPVPRRLLRRRRRRGRLERRATRASAELLAEIRTAGLGLPIDPAEMLFMFLFAARCLASARVLLTALEPSAVVVGSMHGAPARALCRLARELGVPSVYLPHAPVIARAQLADLPVDYAGLRGPQEVAYYRGRGADPSLLESIGDPSLAPAEPPPIEDGLPPVFAPSPQGDTQEAELIELAREVLPEAMVTPHPRSNVRLLEELAPSGWRVWKGRTYDLLRRGPPTVIQHGSGVALEALGLGIPVIELSYPGKPANYPFAAEPYVRMVSDRASLEEAVREGGQDARNRAAREKLTGWAHEWSWPLGDEAAERGGRLIREAASAGPRPAPIWDAWSA
jgi:hypothetical protein